MITKTLLTITALLLPIKAMAIETGPPVITIDGNGTITCKGGCQATIKNGVLVVCRGSVCLQIISSPGKNSPN